MIRYLDAFAELNPLQDELPLSEFHSCRYIVQEVKTVLPEDFDIVDLNAGLEILMQLRRGEWGAIAGVRSETTSFHYTPPLGFFLGSDHLELPERKNGESFRWSEVFAVAALGSVADLATLSAHPKVYEPGLDEFQRIMERSTEALQAGYLEDLPLEAMEALGFARLFQERERFDSMAAITAKKRSEGISKKKLENYHDVKLAIVTRFNELREEGSRLSVRKMARIIYDGLDDDLRSKTVSEDPYQQVESWLGQYKKGTLPGQDRLPSCKA